MHVCMRAYNEHNSGELTERRANDVKCDFVNIAAQLCVQIEITKNITNNALQIMYTYSIIERVNNIL